MRMGVLGTRSPIGIDIGASIHDEQLIALTKDLAMPTALVGVHQLARRVPTADIE